LRKKKIPNIEIIDLGDKGKAVGRTQEGEIVIVEGAVPGDLIDGLAYKKRKGLKHCRVVSYNSLSNDRVDPFCEHFYNCGGCKWQHLDYHAQLRFKEKQVGDCIRRIAGNKDAKILPILGAESDTFYRNKLEFSFSSQRWITEEEAASDHEIKLKNGLGLHPPGRFDKVVDIKKCWLQPDPSNQIRNFIRKWTMQNDYAYYDARRHTGLMRNMILRTSRTGECMLIVAFAKHDQKRIDDLMNAVIQEFPNITSLYYAVNEKLNDSLSDVEMIHYAGNTKINERLGDVAFEIGPKSFFQTNPDQAERLYSEAVAMADLQGGEIVYDLYCGLGSIALYVASKCGKVVGIEEVPEAITDARANAEKNRIGHAHFFTGDASMFYDPSIIDIHGAPDVIITDPPRAGMHPKVIHGILSYQPERLVYVSCNPSTQARDIKMLEGSYQLDSVRPVDMFPHTHHVESVALLRKKKVK
jgi:23S rRNA (uracil1939-C5)-methyltransferase